MPRPKFLPVTRDEVTISRDGETAVFTYSNPAMGAGRNLRIGSIIHRMTDEDIIKLHNDIAYSTMEMRAQYEHIAKEIAVGKPQIKYDKRYGQWSMRGDVIRCCIHDCQNPKTGVQEPVIKVDDKELSWQEFGQMLTTFAGWGMRLTIVPDDELHILPKVKVIETPKKTCGH